MGRKKTNETKPESKSEAHRKAVQAEAATHTCKSCGAQLSAKQLDVERPHICPVCKGPNVEAIVA